jgi:hypothetical protein
MSDDEEQSEAELAMKKRQEAKRQQSAGLDESAHELLEANRQDRLRMEEEINELRARNEKRKKQREQEEKRLAGERAAEEERRKSAEDEKRKKKDEEDQKKQRDRAKKMAEFEKWKNPTGPNFVISKKSEGDTEPEELESKEGGKKSREQLDAEKKAILKQRIQPLEINGFDASKLTEKAKELYKLIYRLEGEKFDLEKRFKLQQVDMMELAERARQANKVGKGGLKRIVVASEEVDKIQERFAGTPAKVEMYSKYERQKDKRDYVERKQYYAGPQFIPPPERIKPSKIVKWSEEGLPQYIELGQEGAPPAEVAQE